METMSKESPYLGESGGWQRLAQSSGLPCPWKGDQVLMAGGEMTRSSMPVEGRWSFFLPDFFLKEQEPWWIPEWVVCENRVDFTWSDQITNRIKNSWQVEAPDRFRAQVADLQAAMAAGALQKAVPVVMAESAWVPSWKEQLELLGRLRNQAHLYPYGFWNDDEGMLGLTPELLFQVSGNSLVTMALAGTRQSGFPKGELLNDPKESKEHQIVVDDIVERLSPLGQVELGKTKEWCIGSLTHLRTVVRVSLAHQKWNFGELVKVLHPTPALGAFPRQAGWDWLQRHRPKKANRFGAPFGVLSPQGDSLCVVAIRNIQWNKGATLLATGCGVVEESQTDQEWHELGLKRQFVLENLGL